MELAYLPDCAGFASKIVAVSFVVSWVYHVSAEARSASNASLGTKREKLTLFAM
jgi:hypothetical protein